MYGKRVYLSLMIMILTVYAIRVTPFLIFRKEIKNKWVKSFLYYVPYVTLAVMTFPAIIQSTQSPWAGVIALVVGIVISYLGAGLFPVACVCCAVVFISEFFLPIPKNQKAKEEIEKTEIIQEPQVNIEKENLEDLFPEEVKYILPQE